MMAMLNTQLPSFLLLFRTLISMSPISSLLLSVFLASIVVQAAAEEYVVYPSVRNDLRLNARLTASFFSLLGVRNVKPFTSRPRQVYEFWLVRATDEQAEIIRRNSGVSRSLLLLPWAGTMDR